MNAPIVTMSDRHNHQAVDIGSYLFTQKRAIFLYESIDDAVAGEVIRQIMYLAATGEEDITLYINSPGGSVTAGFAIYDAMKGVPCDVSTVCTGMAASMGAFLLSAGTKGKRFCMPHSEVMIHQVMGGAQGQAVDVQIAARRMSRMKNELNALLAQHTGQTLERIQQDTDRDYFLTPEEAVEYGLVDAIRESMME